MKISELLLTFIPSVVLTYSICTFSASLAFAGAPIPGDGGVQIVFGDDGAGGTSVTASGTGRTDDDVATGNSGLGFLELDEADTLHTVVPTPLAALPDIPSVMLTDAIEFSWSGVGTFSFDAFDIDFDGNEGAIFTTSPGFVDIPGSGADMTVTDGDGIIPIPYSTFASVHGMSFPSTDGFTFVFEGSAATQAAACADKSALKRKIKKLKKKLKKAKRAGNVSAAKKLKKKLKKLKKKYRSLC